MASNKMEEERIYDIVIIGASGFTGKYVIREALKFLNAPSSPLKSLALAGRNQSKISQALRWASRPNPPPEIPILVADTTDPDSLRGVASHARIILNCVGPYRFYGEPVVAAAVDCGCDYLDICGEPEFMEKVEASYHDRAAEKGSLVISACGFDSIPAELGALFHSRQWASPAAPNRINAYIHLESDKKVVINFATYESAVYGVANFDKLQELRRSRPRKPLPTIPGPPPNGQTVKNRKDLGLWAVKLPSADSAIVRRTLSCLAENPWGIPGVNESSQQIQKREAFWSMVKPAHFGVKLASKSLFGVIHFIIVGLLIGVIGKFSVGRWLLLKFPYVFSLGCFRKKGPTEEEVASASFKMWFVGRGFSDVAHASQGDKKPDMEIITRVTGPEFGYVTTPIILLQCALILLSQRGDLPKGGVFTPGIIFGSTDLQERLQQNGISFDFISKIALSKKALYPTVRKMLPANLLSLLMFHSHNFSRT